MSAPTLVALVVAVMFIVVIVATLIAQRDKHSDDK